MHTNGWFKMHRKIFKNGIWQDVSLFRFFTYLIGQAVYSKEGIKKGNVKIKRGQLLKSYRKIQSELEYIENNSIKNYSLSRINRMVETLKDKNMIKTEKTQLGTLFTIVNYTKYQSKEQEKDKKIKELETQLEQHKNSSGTEMEQQRNNNKNVKEGCKKEKERVMDSASSTERKILKIIKSIEKYPFDFERDIEHIRELMTDYPEVNFLKEVKKWKTYKKDKPLKKNSNARLQLRNWMENSSKWNNNKSNTNKSDEAAEKHVEETEEWLKKAGINNG